MIKLIFCRNPPSRDVLVGFLQKIAKVNGNANFGIDPQKPSQWPDTQWMLQLISTFYPECEIFKRDYMPKAPKIIIAHAEV
jgi:hypothetical protein